MTIHKKFIFSVVSFACGMIMWQAMKNTCPPREQHLQAVTDVVEHAVNRILEERIKIPEESRQLAEFMSATIIPEAVARLTQQRIDFTNYGIISMGQICEKDGNTFPVSFGLFGKVFTFSEDKAYEYLNSLVDETNIENIIQNLNNQNYGKQNIESVEGQ